MRTTFAAVVAVLAAMTIGSVQDVGAAIPPVLDPYEASQRLEIGRWATRNAVGNATCLGIGRNYPGKYEPKRYHVFDCKVTDQNYDNERHLTMTITSGTTFTVKWLTMMEVCAPSTP